MKEKITQKPNTPNKIFSGNSGNSLTGSYHITWEEEDHSANVPNRENKVLKWNLKKNDVHNNLVNSYDSTYLTHCQELNKLFGVYNSNSDETDCAAVKLTLDWLRNDVMHRFWRLTSLMGLDFFVAKNKRIVFIREENQKQYKDGTGRKSITDSEWDHANTNKLRYVENKFVKRVDPIPWWRFW